MEPPLLIIAGIVGFFVLFGLLWFGAIFLVARFGGWQKLAVHYGIESLPQAYNGRWIRLLVSPSRWGVSTYAKSIRLNVDPDAIYLSTHGIFKPFHMPLRLPYADMEIIEPGTGHMKFVVGKSTEVKFRHKPSVHLSFQQKDYDWILSQQSA